MILDLIAIVIIIILAYLLCMNDKNYNCMISHIVIGLTVIVFYKLARYFKLNYTINTLTETNEPFGNFESDINNFINNGTNSSIMSANQIQSLSPAELSAYNQKIDNLIQLLQDYTNSVNASQNNTNISPDNIQKLSLESQEQYQMFQIDYLNKQLSNIKDIINSVSVSKNASTYKPIKIYSSCIVNNPNNMYSNQQTPLSQSSQMATPNSNVQNALQTINTANSQSSSGNGPNYLTSQSQLQSVLGPSSIATPFGTSLTLSPQTGIFSGLLQGLNNTVLNIKQ